MTRIAEALRGLLAATNSKAYRSPEDQERVIEAERALAAWDASRRSVVYGVVESVAEDGKTALVTVADQREAFITALTWGDLP